MHKQNAIFVKYVNVPTDCVGRIIIIIIIIIIYIHELHKMSC
jgi:hypothetical protein